MLPKQKDIEVPLLEALIEIGGEGKPKDIYPLVTKRFPQITDDDLAENTKSGNNRWKNHIQFARLNLVLKGEIDKSVRGIWKITNKGRDRVNSPGPPERPEKKHQAAVDKWKIEEEKKLGMFYKPGLIKTGKVDINEILPKNIWLKENRKEVDGLVSFPIGGQSGYQSVLEVQHKGKIEDLCVRISIILPFVTRVDIVSNEIDLKKIREILERISDSNIVKSRVKFNTFEKFMK